MKRITVVERDGVTYFYAKNGHKEIGRVDMELTKLLMFARRITDDKWDKAVINDNHTDEEKWRANSEAITQIISTMLNCEKV